MFAMPRRPRCTIAAGALGILGGMMFVGSVAQSAPLFDGGQIALVIGGILTLIGTWVTARITGRSKEHEVSAARDKAIAEERTAEAEQRRLERQTFTEQLQAERDAANERTDKANAALDRMWTDKAASREFVAALRAQIWAGGTPPPIMPPAGYIE